MVLLYLRVQKKNLAVAFLVFFTLPKNTPPFRILYLQQLFLHHFKNYRQCRLTFGAGVNLVSGPNGSGKTNLLDAIYYLCFCKSYFQAVEANNVQHGARFFRLDATFNTSGGTEQITVKYAGGQKKDFSRNEVLYDKLSEHIGLLPLVIITPDDISLVKSGSEERRRLLDTTLSQLDRSYLNALISYNKLVQQRNALLKKMAEERTFDAALLDTYTNQLIQPAALLHQKRQWLVQQILPVLQQSYQMLCNGTEQINCTYKSPLNNAPFAVLMQQNLTIDRQLMRTAEGPHRDDLLFEIDNYPLKKFGSQGQQKSFLIALKLAIFTLLAEHKKSTPILLLDDIFDKLDPLRIEQLLRLITQQPFGQVFITDTQYERVALILQHLGVTFEAYKQPLHLFVWQGSEALSIAAENEVAYSAAATSQEQQP